MTQDQIMKLVDEYSGYNYGSAVSKEARAAVVAAIDAQLKQALRDVLEQAAKRCDLVGCWPSLGPKQCAESIREMIGEI